MNITLLYAVVWLILCLHVQRKRWQPVVQRWLRKARQQELSREDAEKRDIREKSEMIDNFNVFSPAFIYALFACLMLALEGIDIIGLLLTAALVSGQVATWAVYALGIVYACHFVTRLQYLYRVRGIMTTRQSPMTLMNRYTNIFDKPTVLSDVKNFGLLIAAFYVVVKLVG